MLASVKKCLVVKTVTGNAVMYEKAPREKTHFTLTFHRQREKRAPKK